MIKKPTTYPELNKILEELVKSTKEILKNNFVGIYLQGSFAIGDYDEYSDVDFVTITNNDLSELELNDLQNMHKRIFDLDSNWAKHIEGSYFQKNIIKDTVNAGEELYYIDNGSTKFVRSNHCNTVLVRWVMHEKAITLSGVKANIIVDKIDIETLKKDIYDTIKEWGDYIIHNESNYKNYFYQNYLVINFCRMLNDLRKGTNNSKLAGVNWAKSSLDNKWKYLINTSWEGRKICVDNNLYQNKADEEIFYQVIDFIKYVMNESDKYYPTQIS